MNRRTTAAAAAPAALLLLCAAPFAAGLRGELIAGRDLRDHFIPRSVALGEALARGEVPRWDPLVFHGASWFGTRSPGVLYPGHLLFAALPVEAALAAYMAAHAAVALLGARALLGPVVGRRGAWAAGLAYGLGGFVVSQHWTFNYLASAAWLPWAAAGGRLAARRPAAGAALVAAALGLTLLAVEPQGALAAAAVAAGLAAAAAPAGDARRRALGAVAAGAALGAALAAVHLVPLLREAAGSDRALAGWGDARYGAPPLGLLASLLAPGVLGEHSAAYLGFWGQGAWRGETPWCGLSVGVAGVVAAALAVASPARRRRAGPGLALLGAGLLLAWTDAGRLVGLRFGAKWLALSALGLAWLVGAGWGGLGGRRAGRLLDAYAAAAVFLAVLVRAAARLGAAALDADPTLSAAAVRAAAGGAAVRLAFVAVALAAVARARARGALGPRAGRAALLGLLALELAWAGAAAVPSTRAPLLARPPLADALVAAARAAGRPEGVPPTWFAQADATGPVPVREDDPDPEARAHLGLRDVLRPNVGQLHGVRSVTAFESTAGAALGRLLRALQAAGPPTPRGLALLDALATVADPRDPLVKDPAVARLLPLLDGRRVALRNLACPPWAYVAAEARPAASEEAAVAATVAPERALTRTVVLGPEGADLAAPLGAAPVTSWAVTDVEFAAERVALTVTSDGPGWLVVREAASPDWRATLDGAPAPLARADALFRAVRVPAGRSRLVMTYAPAWWAPSVLLSGLGLAGLAAVALAGRRAVTPPGAPPAGAP